MTLTPVSWPGSLAGPISPGYTTSWDQGLSPLRQGCDDNRPPTTSTDMVGPAGIEPATKGL
jgi:hypothetical protein